MTLEECTFARNAIFGSQNNSALITVNNLMSEFSSELYMQPTFLILKQSIIWKENSVDYLLVSNSEEPDSKADNATRLTPPDAYIFSSVEMPVFYNYSDRAIYAMHGASPMGSTLPLTEDAVNRTSIDASSPWLYDKQQVPSRHPYQRRIAIPRSYAHACSVGVILSCMHSTPGLGYRDAIDSIILNCYILSTGQRHKIRRDCPKKPDASYQK